MNISIFLKKGLAVILAILTLLSIPMFTAVLSQEDAVNRFVVLTAEAANYVNSNYPSSPIKGYILSSSNKSASAYTSINGSRAGYIYNTDYCTILAVYTSGWLKIKVPWTGYSSPRALYTQMSNFWSYSTPGIITATVKTRAYYKKDLASSPGYIYVGDRAYKVGSAVIGSSTYYQILCPWSEGGYRLVWVNSSAFVRHTHSYKLYYEAAHPHRLYNKCSCGYWYYTGKTQKVGSCTSCYPQTNTYSISDNMITFKNVRLWEYPIGSKFSNTYYCNINGTSIYVGASQCYGYCCYIERKVFGSCWHNNSSHFVNLSGSENVSITEASLKSLITRAGVGAHLRTRKLSSGVQHSMMVIGISQTGFTITDANANGDLKVRVKTYTWKEYVNSAFGKAGFSWIEIHV